MLKYVYAEDTYLSWGANTKMHEHKNCDIIPIDEFDKIKKQLKKTQDENHRLKSILSFGGISTLDTLVDQYMNSSRSQLKKIATEIVLTDFLPDTFNKVHQLIEHLDSVKLQLEYLIEIDEDGLLINNPPFKNDVKLAKSIIHILEILIHLEKFDENKSEKLQDILQSFHSNLKSVIASQ